MRILLLGRGKTGSLVAEVASERGHSVRTLTERENVNGSALTPPFLAMYDVIIDFTTPDAVIPNMRSCLAAGTRMVVGTTGWYERLDEIRGIAQRRGGSLLYGANFSVGVQLFLKLASDFGNVLGAGKDYTIAISEEHHSSKLDSPSGTAKLLQGVLRTAGVEAEIKSLRSGEAAGTHEVEARSATDRIILRHEAFSRRGFAEGAVRGAEWLAARTGDPGVFDYGEIFSQL